MAKQTYLIVGASLTGAKAAETLREEGFDGRIVLIGSEAERPYERPPLSKDFLRGEAAGKPYVHDESFYPEQDIELRLSTTVERIDPVGREVTLSGGQKLSFDRLLITTGAEPRRLRLPGADLDGVHYLRTVEDSQEIRARIETGGRLVTIGAGWIGAEVAASAKSRGCEVTILERGRLPLERVLGPELGRIYRDIHTDHGVELVAEASVEAIEGDGIVAAVRVGGDRRVEADFVVVGVGVVPRVELGRAAGLELDHGIAVDEHLRSSAGSIYAAGDVANAQHPFYDKRIRVEHWFNALHQGPAAARNMLGRDEAYERIPYFFSDQYDVSMEYSGYATGWDEVVFRGDPKTREFVAFWLQDERVAAGMNVNVPNVNEQLEALIRSRAPVDARLLRDPEVPLTEIRAGLARQR